MSLGAPMPGRPGADEQQMVRWADAIVAALYEGGVRDAVVSPGSRSTPFLLALLRSGRIRTTSVIDERAAGFIALGMSRVSGSPTLLLCTSGTAPAHYLPAVIEASASGTPLVVLSADRPLTLAHAGSPQTIDQREIFGRHVRFSTELGDPTPIEGSGVQRVVAFTLAHAVGADPGPVHINARATKPLEPRGPAGSPTHRAPSQVVAAPLGPPDPRAVERIARSLSAARRPAIVAGPMPLSARELTEAASALGDRGIALFPEVTSQLRLGPAPRLRADAFDLWLERRPDVAPDVVVEIGLTPTSSGYARWVHQGGPRERFVLAGARPRDPHNGADAVVLGDVTAALTQLVDTVETTARAGFAAALAQVEEHTWAAIGAHTTSFGEAAAVREVAHALPSHGLLALGNSLPVRHAERTLRGGGTLIRVLSQRGVNGIDGTIAATSGSALVDQGPAALVVGDVTAAYDASSLSIARRVASPLALVVLDNRGGRIFDQLPVAQVVGPATMNYFTTPPEVDFAALASAYQLPFRRADDTPSLRAALEEAMRFAGATLIHVPVPPEGAAEVEARIRSAL